MLEWYEAYADYGDTMARIGEPGRARRARDDRHDAGDLPRPRDRPEGAVEARQARRRAARARPLDARRRRAARAARRARTSTRRTTRPGRSSSTMRSPRSSSRALVEPTILHDYPIELSPFARTTDDDPTIVERFEYFVGGMELGNAFTELNDAEEQAERFAMQAEEAPAATSRPSRATRTTSRRSDVRHAADGRLRARDRPARDGARGEGLDPRRDPLPGPANAAQLMFERFTERAAGRRDGAGRGAGAQAQLHRHRAHPARARARERGRRRADPARLRARRRDDPRRSRPRPLQRARAGRRLGAHAVRVRRRTGRIRARAAEPPAVAFAARAPWWARRLPRGAVDHAGAGGAPAAAAPLWALFGLAVGLLVAWPAHRRSR